MRSVIRISPVKKVDGICASTRPSGSVSAFGLCAKLVQMNRSTVSDVVIDSKTCEMQEREPPNCDGRFPGLIHTGFTKDAPELPPVQARKSTDRVHGFIPLRGFVHAVVAAEDTT